MSYVALRFAVPAREVDEWSDALIEAGAFAIDAADSHAGTTSETPIYAEPGEGRETLWPVTELTALFDARNDARDALARAAANLKQSAPAHESFVVAEKDWVRATQRQFAPIRIDEGFWIVPSWCTPPDPAAHNLTLDPGVAFGTGSHATTRLCLLWLREAIARNAPKSLLDYGCGSGILAIAAKKLGATNVVGTDMDPQALDASLRNARANDVDASFVMPDALGNATFDIVIANILTNTLVTLAPLLASRVRPGGRIALCGILAAQAEEVKAAYRRSFDIGTWRSIDDWSLLAGTRLAHP